jgi:hypothetical protein
MGLIQVATAKRFAAKRRDDWIVIYITFLPNSPGTKSAGHFQPVWPLRFRTKCGDDQQFDPVLVLKRPDTAS